MSGRQDARRGMEQRAGAGGDLGRAWLDFWFSPASPRPLAVVRMLTGLLGLLLAGSYAGDLELWFGPGGMLPADGVAEWSPRSGWSLFALATTPALLWMLFAALLRLRGSGRALGIAPPTGTDAGRPGG